MSEVETVYPPQSKPLKLRAGITQIQLSYTMVELTNPGISSSHTETTAETKVAATVTSIHAEAVA